MWIDAFMSLMAVVFERFVSAAPRGGLYDAGISNGR